MVKIRLKRMGAKKRPFYRLVVADARSPRDGRFIEEIGTYDPIAHPAIVTIDVDRVKEWMRKGAQPTDTARRLLERESILPRTARPQHPRKSVETPEAAAPAAAVASAEAAAQAVEAEAADPELAAAAEAAEEA